MRKRRSTEVFSLSFLDCICCGFGAIILLFVLTIGPIKKKTERNQQAVSQRIEELESTLLDVQEQRSALKRALDQAAGAPEAGQDLEKLRAELRSIQSQVTETEAAIIEQIQQAQASKPQAESPVVSAPPLVPETPEMKAPPSSPVGVTTDSDHLIFLIDTSGSMRGVDGRMNMLVLQQVSRTLNAYPEVRSIQALDTSGNYIVRGTDRTWLPDTPAVRQRIIKALDQYPLTSVSNPVPGLSQVFRDFRPHQHPDKRMGVYIFGDEFPQTASKVLREMDEMNPVNPQTGKRYVTINAVGFPFRLSRDPRPDHTGYKFAHLMRELTYRHDGAFMVVRP